MQKIFSMGKIIELFIKGMRKHRVFLPKKRRIASRRHIVAVRKRLETLPEEFKVEVWRDKEIRYR